MKNLLRPAFTLFFSLTVVCGVLYPLLVTAIAQTAFPRQANGSLITRDGQAVGSELIGQNFDSPGYFWGRLSATTPAYNAAASSGSNFGPLHPNLEKAAQARIKALRKADSQLNSENRAPIPVDLITASSSGLDPQISIAAANYQIARVAKARGLDENQVRKLVAQNTENRSFGVLGEPRVNVLELNLELDRALNHA